MFKEKNKICVLQCYHKTTLKIMKQKVKTFFLITMHHDFSATFKVVCTFREQNANAINLMNYTQLMKHLFFLIKCITKLPQNYELKSL